MNNMLFLFYSTIYEMQNIIDLFNCRGLNDQSSICYVDIFNV